MNTEIDVLMNIYVDLMDNLEHIKNSKLKITKTHDSMKLIDNNYFDVKCNDSLFKQYINMFNDIETYDEIISNLETLKLSIEDKIKNRCDHEWMMDTIDIWPDSSQDICYCVKCEITKK
jgi:hypothetical protein